MSTTCFFDGMACGSMGDCLPCDRFPGTDEAKSRVQAKADPKEALVKARDVLQLDPSQYAGRVLTWWDEAVYGYGTTPDSALSAAEDKFLEMYGFAVRYHELLTAKEE